MESADDNGICQCVTCGKRDHYKNMDAGHFVPGRRQSIVLVEGNIHVQCKHCNDKLNGNAGPYERFMVETYGPDKPEELRALNRLSYTYDRQQLADFRDDFKARIKKQKQRLG